MLLELRVQELGPIGDLTLEPGAGMTALTGETGAGKTLIVEALLLVLGGRSSGQPVRTGAAEAFVQARFDLPGTGERVLARRIPARGRSRAWVDGQMATAQQLASAASGIVDVHGQLQQYSLTSAAGRRRVLDAFAGTDLEPLEAARAALRRIDHEIALLGGDPQSRAREADVLRYQLQEIDDAHLADPAEDHDLAHQEAVLAASGANREALEHAAALLEGGWAQGGGVTPGALDLLRQAGAAIGDRPIVESAAARLAEVVAEAEDVRRELRGVLEEWDDDPARLARVQERRQELSRLRRKYGDTLAEVMAFAERARDALARLDGAEERASALDGARREAVARVHDAEEAVRSRRAASATTLGSEATRRLRDLAMPRAVLQVRVGDTGPGDDVEILFAADPPVGDGPPGEGSPVPGLQPLARSASGGELSRAALALHLVASAGPRTMVFDEVDAGVGGQAAVALAAALREISHHHQVLVVTHLPQVAAVADVHVALQSGGAGPACTQAQVLDDDARVIELARMLSGHPDSPTARAHAAELLVASRPPPGARSPTAGRQGGEPTSTIAAGHRR